MSKQAIEQIKTAEQNADDLILRAEQQAEEMILGARADITEKKAEHSAKLEAEKKEAMQGVSMQVNIMRDSTAKDAEKKALELENKYNKLFDKAVSIATNEALK